MERELKEMFEKLKPSLKQKEDLWEQINKKRQKEKSRKWIPAVAISILFLTAFAGIYIIFSGDIIQAMKNLFGIEERQKEIVVEEKKEGNVCEEIIRRVKNVCAHNEMYAPRIVLCSDELIIFANTAGMIVYDKKEEQIIMTVDLQEIGCSYIEIGGYIETVFLLKDDLLYIFNEMNGTLKNIYYVLNLSPISDIEKKSFGEYTKKERKEKKKQFYDEWKEYEKNHYKDAFKSLSGEKILKAGNIYSEFAFYWKDGKRKKISSIYIDKKNRYYIFTKDKKSGETEKKELSLFVKENIEEDLPKFTYSGEDKVLESICNYFCKEAEERQKEEKKLGIYKKEVYIPAPIIFKKIQNKKTMLVFLEMTYGYYYKNGVILEQTSAGSYGIRMKLKNTEKGYKVIECLFAGDGSRHHKSIEDFTKGYPKITRKYFDYEMLGRQRAKMEKEMYRLYLKENEYNIIYYRGKGGRLKKIKN